MKVLPGFTIELIGALIAISLLMFIFAVATGPVTGFLNTQQAITSFTRFSNSLSRSCRIGSDTVAYLDMVSSSDRVITVYALVNSNIRERFLTELESCPEFYELDTQSGVCTTRISKSILDGTCGGRDFCFCLLRVYLNPAIIEADGSLVFIREYEFNLNSQIITVDLDVEDPLTREQIGDVEDRLNKSINIVLPMALQLDNNQDVRYVGRVDVLLCRNFRELGCVYEGKGDIKFHFPILPQAYDTGETIIWMDSTSRRNRFIQFTSISMHRALYGIDSYYYNYMYTEPKLDVINYEDVNWGDFINYHFV